MELLELFQIIKKYYGNKASNIYIDSSKNEVIAELYESFVTKYSIDNYHNEFFAGVLIGDNSIICAKLLGKDLAMTCNNELIIKNLGIIDEYCRLRLPDKFLDVYDNAYLKD